MTPQAIAAHYFQSGTLRSALERDITAAIAAAEAAAYERAAQVADAQYQNAVSATQGYGEWARCATAIAAAIRALT